MWRTVPIPILDDNYAWMLLNEKAERAVVVDPGEAGPVARALQRAGVSLEAILVTHHHGDHTAGVSDLATAGVAVYGPTGEDIATVDRPVDEGDRVELPEVGLELAVLHVPGHTAGHVAYLGEGLLLPGDTLFAGGCGRVFEGTFEQMYHSLERLAGLPEETLVCCAHEYTLANLRFAREVEPDNRALAERLEAVQRLRSDGRVTLPSNIGLECRTNPFLRCLDPAVVASAGAHAGRRVAPGADAFAVVRTWKDGWRG